MPKGGRATPSKERRKVRSEKEAVKLNTESGPEMSTGSSRTPPT